MAKDRPTHRTPRTVDAARKLLERFAELEDSLVAIEATRNAAIVAANATADEDGASAIAEREEIRTKLEPWWKTAGATLTGGKRKSAELGGCIVGTVAGRDSLAIEGDEDAVITALGKRAWAKPLLRVKTTLDRAAILKSLDGVYRKQLAALGLTCKTGETTFFVKRTEQGRTQAELQA